MPDVLFSAVEDSLMVDMIVLCLWLGVVGMMVAEGGVLALDKNHWFLWGRLSKNPK
jgi:hypothetical protein